MAFTAVPGGLWVFPPVTHANSAPTLNEFSLIYTAGTSYKYAAIIQAPKTGTLDRFGIHLGTVAQAPTNGIRFSFQDIGANGYPDLTEDQYAVVTSGIVSNAWLEPASYLGSTGAGSGTKRAVNRGDFIACLVRLENNLTGDSVGIYELAHASPGGSIGLFPVTYKYATSSTISPNLINFALRYDDGIYYNVGSGIYPITSVNSESFSSSSSPADEIGTAFSFPFTCKIDRCYFRADLDGDTTIKLYDSDGSTPLSEIIFDEDLRAYANGANIHHTFEDGITIQANQTYRLTVLPGSTAITLYTFGIPSTAYGNAVDGGSTWQYTYREDAGSWTEVPALRCWMGIHVSEIEVSSSGAASSILFVGG